MTSLLDNPKVALKVNNYLRADMASHKHVLQSHQQNLIRGNRKSVKRCKKLVLESRVLSIIKHTHILTHAHTITRLHTHIYTNTWTQTHTFTRAQPKATSKPILQLESGREKVTDCLVLLLFGGTSFQYWKTCLMQI